MQEGSPRSFGSDGTRLGGDWDRTLRSLFNKEDMDEMSRQLPRVGNPTRWELKAYEYLWVDNGEIKNKAMAAAFVALQRDSAWYQWHPNHHNAYFQVTIKRLVAWVTFEESKDRVDDPRDRLNTFEYNLLVSWERCEFNRMLTQQKVEAAVAKALKASQERERVGREQEYAHAVAVADTERAAAKKKFDATAPPLGMLYAQEDTQQPVLRTATRSATTPRPPPPTTARTSADDGAVTHPQVEEIQEEEAEGHTAAPVTGQGGRSAPSMGTVINDIQAKKCLPSPWKKDDPISRAEISKYLKKMQTATNMMSRASTADIVGFIGETLATYIDRAANGSARGPVAHAQWQAAGGVGEDPSWRALRPKEMYALAAMLFEPDHSVRSATNVLELFATKEPYEISLAEPDKVQKTMSVLEEVERIFRESEFKPDGTGWFDPPQRRSLLEMVLWILVLRKKGEPGVVNTSYSPANGTRDENIRMELYKRMLPKISTTTSIVHWNTELYSQVCEMARDFDKLERLGFGAGSKITNTTQPRWCGPCGTRHLKDIHLTAAEKEALADSKAATRAADGKKLDLDKAGHSYSKRDLKRMRAVIAQHDGTADGVDDEARSQKKCRVVVKTSQGGQQSGQQSKNGGGQKKKRKADLDAYRPPDKRRTNQGGNTPARK